MYKLLLSSMFSLLILLPGSIQASHLSGKLLVSTKLTGDQQVPAITTDGVGVATMMISENRDSICINVGVTMLSGPIAGIHIHEGVAGSNGSVVVNLTDFIDGEQVQAVLTGTDVTDVLIAGLLSGTHYLNVHTAANPDGEIRGQLNLEKDINFLSSLDGLQEVPSVVTAAFGLGNFNLALHQGELKFHVVVDGLSGPITGTHLHLGAVGTNGGVVLDLTSFVSGNVITGTITPDSALIADMMAGNIYLNVHTGVNPGGEIRGQLEISSDGIMLDAAATGNQEVPPVSTTAQASAFFKMDYMFGSIEYDIVATSLSGSISGAHLHTGNAGSNGPVIVDLSGSIVGNRISGTINSSELSDSLIHDLLAGGIYLNIHTASNPGGEIRGQVYRLAREGYTASLNGAQEVPAVATEAQGTALVSMDRDQSNLHVMIVASGLSGTLTGAHFHNAAAGSTGAVIYDLTPWFAATGTSDAAFGYWKSSDTTPFTTTESVEFRGDNVYLNLHNADNSDGEIRGQITRGGLCETNMSTGIDQVLYSEVGITTFPNPANDELYVTLDQNIIGQYNIDVIDITGRVMISVTSGSDMRKKIDIEGLNPGMYLVRVIANNSGYVSRIIVE